jgi:hypothetical protein
MGSKKARKPAPVPQAAAAPTMESMQDQAKEMVAKKKKRKYSLEDTMSVFGAPQGNPNDLG